jgi:hypothetical protein
MGNDADLCDGVRAGDENRLPAGTDCCTPGPAALVPIPDAAGEMPPLAPVLVDPTGSTMSDASGFGAGGTSQENNCESAAAAE